MCAIVVVSLRCSECLHEVGRETRPEEHSRCSRYQVLRLKRITDCPSWAGYRYQHEKTSVCDRCWDELQRRFDLADDLAAQQADRLLYGEEEEDEDGGESGKQRANE